MRQAKPVLVAAFGLGLALGAAAWFWRQAPEAAPIDLRSAGPVLERSPAGPAGATAEDAGGEAARASRRPARQGPGAALSEHGATPGAGAPAAAAGPASEDGAASVWSVDAEGIQGAMREALPGIRDCYQAWLGVNPELEGRVEVSFTIGAVDTGGAVGGVTDVSIPHSELGHAAMESCVANVAGGLQFDVPDDPVDVTYPFVFTTE